MTMRLVFPDVFFFDSYGKPSRTTENTNKSRVFFLFYYECIREDDNFIISGRISRPVGGGGA